MVAEHLDLNQDQVQTLSATYAWKKKRSTKQKSSEISLVEDGPGDWD